MRPMDEFAYLKGNHIALDFINLTRYYLPIIGGDGMAVYQYLVAFYDATGKKHKFSEILNHTQFGMSRFEQALALLTALDLVCFYRLDDSYLVELREPHSGQTFLANPLYHRLLEKRIGEVALSELGYKVPERAKNLSKAFSETFDLSGEVDVQQSLTSKTGFDLQIFKQQMLSDGLRFKEEREDIIALFNISEKFQLDTYATYQLAKDTASRHVIQVKRMVAKQEQTHLLPQLSDKEAIILKEAQTNSAEAFLAKIKKSKQAVVTDSERKLLSELVDMGFLDEVINVMVLYTLNKTNSANVKKAYLMTIANDFAFQQVSSAADAIEKMRHFDQRKKKIPSKMVKSNVPEWSQKDYKNETTQEEQERLDEIKRQTLARLRGEK